MDRPLFTLRDTLDAYLTELARLHLAALQGRPPGTSLAALHARYPEASSAETYQAAREALERARAKGDGVQARRLELVRELVATQLEQRLALEAHERVAALEATAQLPVDEGTLPLAEVLHQLPREPSRARRDLLERAAGRFLWEQRGAYGARAEAPLQLAEALGAGDYAAVREAATGIALGGLLEQAAQVLRDTEDAYRDVLGYALKKLDPQLKALPHGGARRHDLQAALRFPWLEPVFRREDVRHAVERWLLEWGLVPDAGRRIRASDEGPARAACVAVRVPHEVHLLLRPEAGPAALGTLLHEHGHAQALARVGEALPVELRRLSDASVGEAWAALFEHLGQDTEWLKRYLRLPTATAKDAARLAAFQALAVLRRQCALLPHALSLAARGPSPERAEEYASALRGALFVEPHSGFFLYDVDPQLYAARYLRGAALEARLFDHVTRRFNEDWWRNPAARAFCEGRWALGGQEEAERLGQELGGGAALALVEAARRWVAALDA